MKRILVPSLLVLAIGLLIAGKKATEFYTKKEIVSYSKNIGIPENDLYFIKEELQQKYLEKGQPNTIVLDKSMRKLKAATCYEEYPYYLDTFYEFKSQVKDTLTMYDTKFDGDVNHIFKTIQGGEKLKLDPAKKYHIFYYFAKYARFKDKEIKKSVKRYKDSVQYFFVNVDNIRE